MDAHGTQSIRSQSSGKNPFIMFFGVFFKIFFFMWTIFKVFIEFVTILFLFYALVFWPQCMWDLSFPTRDRTHTCALEGKVLTTAPPGKFPFIMFCKDLLCCLGFPGGASGKEPVCQCRRHKILRFDPWVRKIS